MYLSILSREMKKKAKQAKLQEEGTEDVAISPSQKVNEEEEQDSEEPTKVSGVRLNWIALPE